MVDTIKATFTYTTALVIVAGGLIVIYLTRNDAAASEIRLLVAGFVGSALTFLFSSEVQTRTARQAASSTAAAQASQPTITSTSGPPASVTVAPTDNPETTLSTLTGTRGSELP